MRHTMNGGMFLRGFRRRTPSRPARNARKLGSFLLLALVIGLSGCAYNEAVPELVSEEAVSETEPSPPARLPEVSEPLESEPPRRENLTPGPESERPGNEQRSAEGSGEMVWAEGFEGQLIAGLDGELYEPYHALAIERVQQALERRGLYDGPVNGILDAPTMTAIYALQESHYGLQRCGIPTPRTRQLLQQGSHTF